MNDCVRQYMITQRKLGYYKRFSLSLPLSLHIYIYIYIRHRASEGAKWSVSSQGTCLRYQVLGKPNRESRGQSQSFRELPGLPASPLATQFRVLFFHPPNGTQQPPKTIQRRPKRYPLHTIFYDFGAPGGNVKTMVSCTRNHRFHSWSGSSETPEGLKKTLQKNIQKK